MYPQRRPDPPAPDRFDPISIILKHSGQALSGLDRSLGRHPHPFEKEGKPRFPVTGVADLVK